MESKRFEVVASTKEVIVSDKEAFRIELQYGKEGGPTELVIAELYPKDGAWKYSRGQVRIDCTKDNAKAILENIKAMYESSGKVEKKAKIAPAASLTDAIKTMSDGQKAALLAMLVGEAKTTPTKSADLVLDHNLSKRMKGGRK